jgi:8-oxo-dGTP diphosphatase
VNHKYPDFEITMYSFICPVDEQAINLKEHINIEWLNIELLNTLDWAAADLPIVQKLMQEGI